MLKHTRLSGAAKRKNAAAVAAKVKQLPKVTEFFSSAATTSANATSGSISNVPPDSPQMPPLVLPDQTEVTELHASNTASAVRLQPVQDDIAYSEEEGQCFD